MKKGIETIIEILFWGIVSISILGLTYLTFFKAGFEWYFNGVNIIMGLMVICMIQGLQYLYGKTSNMFGSISYNISLIIYTAIIIIAAISGTIALDIQNIINTRENIPYYVITGAITIIGIFIGLKAQKRILKRNLNKVISMHKDEELFNTWNEENWAQLEKSIKDKDYQTIYTLIDPYLEMSESRTEEQKEYWNQRQKREQHLRLFLDSIKKEK